MGVGLDREGSRASLRASATRSSTADVERGQHAQELVLRIHVGPTRRRRRTRTWSPARSISWHNSSPARASASRATTRARSKYEPHDASCPNQTDQKTNATDLEDRRVDDFIWQRQPWKLYEPGEPTIVFPGVDYLAAYWIARRYELAKDDRAGTCARFDGP